MTVPPDQAAYGMCDLVDNFRRFAQDALRIVHDEQGRLPGRPPMTEDDIVEVLRSAL